MRVLAGLLFVCLTTLAPGAPPAEPPQAANPLTFVIRFPASLSSRPVDGRVLLAISREATPEPRFGILEEEAKSQQLFGLDVEGLGPEAPAVLDAKALGYPLRSLAELPAGDYWIQAVLNRYETFARADGHTLKLPPDQGEGQQWNLKPGNFYSRPMRIHLDPARGREVAVTLTERIPAIEPPKDTKYVKHFRIQSRCLTEFWGRPMYLGAIVVLPEGFEEHPEAHYPLLVNQGHFPADFDRFRTEPPAPDAKGNERIRQQIAYRLYQDWTSGRLPRVLLLQIQHANPYYDDSYAVNSANVGPYGDAIIQELIPEVERRFRGIGQGWARGQYGGSTGGWTVLAQQIFYPEEYNWTYAWSPDPIDFHAYQIVDLYHDRNAFWQEGPFGRVPRPEMRNPLGLVTATMEPAVRREEVIGSRGRSAEQFAIWQALFSPVGADGYPKPIWDPATGRIDSEVAAYWREHYDLNHILQRDWATLAPKLTGKLHLVAGEMDDWYLNNAVRRFQDFHDSPKNPYKVADFDFGPRRTHSYSGGKDVPMIEWYGTFIQRMVTRFAERLDQTAPAQADLSWKY